MKSLSKNIILGISGSIAAYKSPMILRALQKAGSTVRVVMTPSATEFVSPLVLANLSKHSVAIDMFHKDIQRDGSWHIHLARECDLMLIAPASAKTIASLAYGLCDTALSCVALALPATTPLVIAPAMDTEMWEHPSTKHNIDILRSRGVQIIEPQVGELASGLFGVGRLAEVDHILDFLSGRSQGDVKHSTITARDITIVAERTSESLADAIEKDAFNAELSLHQLKKITHSPTAINSDALKGKTVLITAGPTRERIDDVRYISNYSSGKMGYALAKEACAQGADVILVSGPVSLAAPAGVETIQVETAQQMYEVVLARAETYDYAILSAAVADFKPTESFEGKIKKQSVSDEFMLSLTTTPDILATLGARKLKSQTLVGFALESENQLNNSLDKLQRKKCDMIVSNSSAKNQSAIGSDFNTISLFYYNGEGIETSVFDRAPKDQCAKEIIRTMLSLMPSLS